MAGLLVEVAVAVARRSTKSELVLVDAAAGKAYVGFLAAELILAPRGQPARVRVIEREPARAAACRDAITRLRAPGVAIDVVAADVGDAAAWPQLPISWSRCTPAVRLLTQSSISR